MRDGRTRAAAFAHALLLFALCLALSGCAIELPYHSGEDFGIPTAISPVDFDGDGTDDYRELLLGARRDARNKPTYDDRYWEEGYPPEDIGVCADVIWRAFREAGYDLRAMVDRDVRLRPAAYPHVTTPDDNIDFRRVVNLEVFFRTYGISLTCDPSEIEEWQPGDVVIFANSAGRYSHIGVISDRRTAKGVTYVIHNGGQEEREENFLGKMRIAGHYRFDASRIDPDLLIPWED